MKAMDFVCTDVLPATLADECVKFVDAYGHTAINYLLLEVDSDIICEEIKLCSSAVMILPAPTHVKLLKESDGMKYISILIALVNPLYSSDP